ncbi:hypothetical protein [Maribellus sediminis]|uniref:hypothetical protein n=1 Tax=Maribellus sediminis TaxID=2696285 RepID=UPI0014302213|nr:hypothetical protein [Maribellus sediminis]
MNRTVTQEETTELFKVCENYGVFFYDVQIEIVDHLASIIEEQWKKNPELEFKQAQKNAISSFGKNNFTKMVRTKEKEVNRKYNLLLWKYLLEFYKWPKILLTFVLTLGVFIVFQTTSQTKSILLIYSGIILVLFTIYLFFIFPKIKISGKTGKMFLLASRQSQSMYLIIILLQLPNLIHSLFNWIKIESVENKMLLAALSFFLVGASILLYANMFFLPKKIKQHFTEQFPEFVK